MGFLVTALATSQNAKTVLVRFEVEKWEEKVSKNKRKEALILQSSEFLSGNSVTAGHFKWISVHENENESESENRKFDPRFIRLTPRYTASRISRCLVHCCHLSFVLKLRSVSLTVTTKQLSLQRIADNSLTVQPLRVTRAACDESCF